MTTVKLMEKRKNESEKENTILNLFIKLVMFAPID